MRTTEAVAHVKHSNIRAYVHLPTKNVQFVLNPRLENTTMIERKITDRNEY